MPKDEKKKHLKNAAVSISSPWELIGLLLKSKTDQAEAITILTEEGPAHKQIYSALVLKSMHQLIGLTEQVTGEKFTAVISGNEESIIALPKINDADDALIETLAKAPLHEQLAFNALLQGMSECIRMLKGSEEMK